MKICQHEYDPLENVYRCKECGSVVCAPAIRECPHVRLSASLPIEYQSGSNLHYFICPHRGDVLAKINARAAGVGCSSSEVEIFQCRKFNNEPVLQSAGQTQSCFERISLKVIGYTGRTCRDCKALTTKDSSMLIHCQIRDGWQNILARSRYALASQSLNVTIGERTKPTQEDIRDAIDGGARAVINHGFILKSDSFFVLAREYPNVQFVGVNHCSLNHTWGQPHVWPELSAYREAMPTCRNLWLASPDQAACWSDVFPADVSSRCIWWPNPVLLPREPSSVRPDPPVVLLTCRSDTIKAIPAQVLGMAIAKRQRSELRLVTSFWTGSAAGVVQMTGANVEVWPYAKPDAFGRRLRDDVSVVVQASLSESFNYVSIDAMGYGRPIVGSQAIRFCPTAWQAHPDRPRDIARIILHHLDYYDEAARMARLTAEQLARQQNLAYAQTITRLLEACP